MLNLLKSTAETVKMDSRAIMDSIADEKAVSSMQ